MIVDDSHASSPLVSSILEGERRVQVAKSVGVGARRAGADQEIEGEVSVVFGGGEEDVGDRFGDVDVGEEELAETFANPLRFGGHGVVSASRRRRVYARDVFGRRVVVHLRATRGDDEG